MIPFFLWCILLGCTDTTSPKEQASIKGIWYLNQWTTYHTLIFSDRSVQCDNNIDTVFSLGYIVRNDSLITMSDANDIKGHKIIRLTNTDLVLDGFHDSNEQRKYSREKKKWN